MLDTLVRKPAGLSETSIAVIPMCSDNRPLSHFGGYSDFNAVADCKHFHKKRRGYTLMKRNGLNPLQKLLFYNAFCLHIHSESYSTTSNRWQISYVVSAIPKIHYYFSSSGQRTSRVGVSRLVAAMMNCFSAVKPKMDLAYHHQKSQNGCP